MRSIRLFATVCVAPLLASCGDSLGPRVGTSWVLQTVDGERVPAAYHTLLVGTDSLYAMRVLGRTLEFLSRDSAHYEHATDEVVHLPGGTLEPLGFRCTSQRVGYRREANRLILAIDPNRGIVHNMPPLPIVYDTLEVSGSGLIQRVRALPGIMRPAGSEWRLDYREDEPRVRPCSLAPEPPFDR
jgi:hypothetical protein